MKYNFTLNKSYNIYISDLKGVHFYCQWGYISNGLLGIKKGYSWDGCTCAIDTDRTYTACLVHDFLCQFRPVDRKTRDWIFFRIMKANRFELSYLYFIAVKIYGCIYFLKNNLLIFVKKLLLCQ
jgi:hypothetical protein